MVVVPSFLAGFWRSQMGLLGGYLGSKANVRQPSVCPRQNEPHNDQMYDSDKHGPNNTQVSSADKSGQCGTICGFETEPHTNRVFDPNKSEPPKYPCQGSPKTPSKYPNFGAKTTQITHPARPKASQNLALGVLFPTTVSPHLLTPLIRP